MANWAEYVAFAAQDALVKVPCPRCDGYWFQDIEPESGFPYTCFCCGNDSISFRKYEAEEYQYG